MHFEIVGLFGERERERMRYRSVDRMTFGDVVDAGWGTCESVAFSARLA